MARSRSSDDAYHEFCRTHADEAARIDCFRTALALLRRFLADPRVTEPEIARELGDTSRSRARRLPELAAMNYFVMAGEKHSIFSNGEVGPLANAWTTPELYDALPDAHKVVHVKIAAEQVPLSRAHKRFIEAMRHVVSEARLALQRGEGQPEIDTTMPLNDVQGAEEYAGLVAALQGIIENLVFEIRRAETRELDQPQSP